MKYLKQSIAILCFLSIISFVACKKEDKSPSSESCTNNGYLKFLKVGHKLTYNYSDISTDDSLLTMEITSITSGDAYKYDLTGGGTFTGTYKNRYIKECNDWMLVNVSTDPTSASDKTYPTARKTGDKWTVGTTNNYLVVATGVSITTDAGIFICDKIAYNQTGAFNTDTIYYSNDIGWVKYDGWLMEYSLKSKNF
jgi:hypothetical protein